MKRKIRSICRMAAMVAAVAMLAVQAAMAVPALPGLWKTLLLHDGTQVRARLCGDEAAHFWLTEDGQRVVERNDTYYLYDPATDNAQAEADEARARMRRQRNYSRRQARRIDQTHYTGKKRGLIILVEFKNKKFQYSHDRSFFQRMANEEGFSSQDGFIGSVRDYFLDQSNGMFDLSFDVVGPVAMPNNYEYYGSNENGYAGYDEHAGEMVAKACQSVANDVNFADYDWDNDGWVDQVMVIYAGEGEADGGNKNTIWPHEYDLYDSDYGRVLYLDRVYINTYACSNEMSAFYNNVCGIGTLCHEFSHCLGLPDYYDTLNDTNYGLGTWSIMSSGSYNGSGFCPAGYTSIDKWMCGWLTPTELNADTTITAMAAMSEGGPAYLLRNEGFDDEFYLLENRQQTGWDAALSSNGMLILHVDYDKKIWEYNEVNSTTGTDTRNTHQRCTLIHADGNAKRESTSPFPYGERDSLTRTSSPAATLYNENADGSLLMNKSVLGIRQAADGTMRFSIRLEPPVRNPLDDLQPGDTLFYESFNLCNGTGGNDNLWSGTIAQKTFVPDHRGWKDYAYARAGKQCARFGNGSSVGVVASPEFTINGKATLSFLAAPFGSDGKSLSLYASNSNISIEPASVSLETEQWTACRLTLTGKGSTSVTFLPAQRMFLDEVVVTHGETESGIRNVVYDAVSPRQNVLFDLQGRRINATGMQRGIYIRNGKKYLSDGK